ncbi:hypothetical protein EVAR_51080_1 [Eumeta japonica]|uniref:Uncharacterized protein n=1 Tax=Eumeta variegata TaxID=151549 RepID=A0A4C1XLU1_EUMVA|nr:hypothetical protein EVAR_51080_1 [Eumeta japonica]
MRAPPRRASQSSAPNSEAPLCARHCIRQRMRALPLCAHALGSENEYLSYVLLAIQYRCEVTHSVAAFHPVSESFGGQLTPPSHQFLDINPLSIRYLIPTLEDGNALVTPLGLRVSMSDGDHLIW